ncbi:MAG: hypothetical protein ACE3JK_01170 [Sporolactobacillus sp.]
MMGPTEIVELLRADSALTALVPAENIKAFNVPAEWVDNNVVPRILVTEVSAPFNRFGSDHAQGRVKREQVQGWFDLSADVDAVQKALNMVLENSRWFNSYDAGIAEDPDTSELFFTMQYSKNQIGV